MYMCVYTYIYIYIYIYIFIILSDKGDPMRADGFFDFTMGDIRKVHIHRYTHVYMYICIHVLMCMYIYIYIERERHDMCVYVRVCMYIYIYIYIIPGGHPEGPAQTIYARARVRARASESVDSMRGCRRQCRSGGTREVCSVCLS